MTVAKELLPDPATYFGNQNLSLKGSRYSKWKTTQCVFHDGSDSMRVNVQTGAFKCMNCGVGGGDVLSYHCQAHGMDFVDAAKALNVWVESGRLHCHRLKPTPLPPRAALEVLARESMIVAVAAGNLARGVILSNEDRARLVVCAGRINAIAGDFA